MQAGQRVRPSRVRAWHKPTQTGTNRTGTPTRAHARACIAPAQDLVWCIQQGAATERQVQQQQLSPQLSSTLKALMAAWRQQGGRARAARAFRDLDFDRSGCVRVLSSAAGASMQSALVQLWWA